jgi:hypothetical protein
MTTALYVLRRPFRTGLTMVAAMFLLAGVLVCGFDMHPSDIPAWLDTAANGVLLAGLLMMMVGAVAFLVRHNVVPTLWDFLFVNFLFSLLDN